MKKLKILLLAMCPLMITQAQTTLFVKAKTGTITTFNLSNLKMLTFAGNNVIVNKKDASSSTFLRTDVQYINFGVMPNGLPELAAQTNETMRVFPNPVQDVLNIEISNTNSQSAQIEIIGIDGKVVMRTLINNATNSISVATLPKGLYLLRNSNGTSNKSTKFIKQ